MLFDMPAEKIDVLIHPQSVIHSMVEYADGAVMAQLGTPDMRLPILYAMAYPDRLPTGGKRLDLFSVGGLTSSVRTRRASLPFAWRASACAQRRGWLRAQRRQ